MDSIWKPIGFCLYLYCNNNLNKYKMPKTPLKIKILACTLSIGITVSLVLGAFYLIHSFFPNKDTRYTTYSDTQIYDLYLALDDDNEIHYSYTDYNGNYYSGTDQSRGICYNFKKGNVSSPQLRRTTLHYTRNNGNKYSGQKHCLTFVLPRSFRIKHIDD